MSETTTPDEPTVDAPAVARRVLRSVPFAALATLTAADAGRPYASLVAAAVGHDGTPVLLLSTLSDHTRNLQADGRASLLFDHTHGLANRMAGERVTLTGRLAPLAEGDVAPLRRRFLARHPGAAGYEGFADFAYWSMAVERAHLVGGFAKAFWVDGADLLPALPEGYALAEAEAGILEHMNADHREAVDVYARHLARKSGQGWRMTGIDREGIDLRRSGETARVSFPAPVDDADAAREALIALVAEARAAAGDRSR